MAVSITSQPAVESLNAAYRPITITVSGANPVVYCDIYFNEVYYKTLSKTQAPFIFDIQNAAQEYLRHYLAPNGSAQIFTASSLIVSAYVQVRGSTIDENGFVVPDAPIPVQATGTTAAIAGGGTRSNGFYIINSALQHEDNQDIAAHMAAYKTGTWSANTYPLTHRVDGYNVGRAGSDYFPIVSNIAPSGVRLHYRLRGQSTWQTSDGEVTPQCVPVEVAGTPIMPNGTVGQAYNFSFNLTGTSPFAISGTIKPAWMNIAIAGSTVTITGTPAIPLASNPVQINLTNSCGSTTFNDDISTAAGCIGVAVVGTTLPDATEGQPYNESITLTGSGPHTLSSVVKPAWMAVGPPSGNSVPVSGTPTAPANNVTVSFNVNNACGTDSFSDTINVLPLGARFGGTTFNGGNALNETETANLLGTAGTTVTIEMDNYTNTNGGQLQVNGVQVTGIGQTWTYTLNGAGQAAFTVEMFGLAGQPGSNIFAHFRVTAVSSGPIGTPDSYQISKTFT